MFKSIKNFFLAMSITVLAVSSANAALISHDILFDDFSTTDVMFEKIGYFVVDTDKADSWGEITSWEELQIDILGSSFKFFTEAEAVNVGNLSFFDNFLAIVDPDNVFAGVEALGFNLTEKITSTIKFQADFGFSPGPGTFDMFGAAGDPAAFQGAGNIKLGSVELPEPPMILLFLTGLIALRLQKRKA